MKHWKKLLIDEEWKTEGRTLLFLILGLILISVIHFFSQRNIYNNIAHGRLLERDQQLDLKLGDIENHLLVLESTMHNYLRSGDNSYYQKFNTEIQEAKKRFDEIEQILSVENDQPSESLVQLKKHVQIKIDYHQTIVEVFRKDGKEIAEQHLIEKQEISFRQGISEAKANFEDLENINVPKKIELNRKSDTNNILLDNLAFVIGMLFLVFALFYLFRTILKRIKLQERLLSAKEEVENSAQIKELFLANMSHEIRTPLQAILAYSNRLHRAQLNEHQTEYVQGIQAAGDNLLGIVNDILDISKIESEMISFEAKPFNMAELLRSLDGMFQYQAAQKGIYLTLHPNSSLPEVLIGDSTHLRRILVNLIGNAIKFTEKGGVDVFIKAEKQEPQDLKLHIIVKDTGVGIPKEKLSIIFDRFEQVDAQVTRKFGGSGLGLYIVYKLIEIQGGQIVVQSELNKGSSFQLEIPYLIASKQDSSKASKLNISNQAGHFKETRILVVEDNLMNQKVVGDFLTDWGIEYDLAENGKIAIQQIEQHPYDLVLMDVQMPEMDGYSATEYIRENLKIQTPIVAMTAHAFTGEREKALGHGMDEFISKPIQEEDLFQILARFSPLEQAIESTPYKINPTPLIPVDDASIIDYNYLIDSSNGKREYIRRIFSVFLRQAPKEIAEMQLAVGKSDFEGVRSIAHSLKSTIGYAGLGNKLNPNLELLERQAASNPNQEKLKALIHELDLLIQKAIEEIETKALPWANDTETPPPTE